MHRTDASTHHARYGRATATSTSCATVDTVVWLRRGLVVVLLAAPIGVVAVVAWPEEGSGGGGGARTECADGSGPDGALVAGDEVEGDLGFGAVVTCSAVGDGGALRFEATAPNADLTLTVVDGDGDQLAYNDDDNGLDPAVTVDLDDGQEVDVEVRELGSAPASFLLSVEAAED